MTKSLLRVLSNPPARNREPLTARGPAQRECMVTLQRLDGGELTDREDTIAVESDIVIRSQDRPDITLSRTPGDDLNLIMGHLFCNSLIGTPEEVVNLDFRHQEPARVDVSLQSGKFIRRRPLRPAVHLTPEHLFELKETFEYRQNLFKNTGSTHAAALFSLKGRLLAFGEDVGRHNAFDKAIGRALLEGTLRQAAIAMISSRIAVELAAKAMTANIPVLCGFSAATSSGVSYAKEHDITLVGRLKRTSFDVYTNAWRFQENSSVQPIVPEAGGYAPQFLSGRRSTS